MLIFEWDDEKNWSNFLKHGLEFEEAQVIWSDPLGMEFYDENNSESEARYLRVGHNPGRGILVVIFCERKDVIRIISARKATKDERIEYERQLRLK